MQQNDIKEILSLLKRGIKHGDWDIIQEAIDNISEFYDDPMEDED